MLHVSITVLVTLTTDLTKSSLRRKGSFGLMVGDLVHYDEGALEAGG